MPRGCCVRILTIIIFMMTVVAAGGLFCLLLAIR